MEYWQFVLSALARSLAAPGNLLVFFLFCGVCLLWTRARALGRAIVAVCGISLAAVAVLPLSSWVVRPLESRFPPVIGQHEDVAGVIVLGGALQPALSAAWQQPHFNHRAERVMSALALVERNPGLRLVYTGGSASLQGGRITEAEVARQWFTAVGVDPAALTLEAASRNTYENAVFSARLLQPRPNDTWILMTSAMHMPRAVGAFRKAGFSVLPYPVDYSDVCHDRAGQTLTEFLPNLATNLSRLADAAHEWLGLLTYWWFGWSDALYPAPEHGRAGSIATLLQKTVPGLKSLHRAGQA